MTKHITFLTNILQIILSWKLWRLSSLCNLFFFVYLCKSDVIRQEDAVIKTLACRLSLYLFKETFRSVRCGHHNYVICRLCDITLRYCTCLLLLTHRKEISFVQ